MIDKRMTKARMELIHSQPFFGTLATYLELIEDESCETMATDGTKLYYAPSFLDTCHADEIRGVVAHEVMHCAYNHHTRRGTRDADLWNEACDYVINLDLLAAGFTLPKGAYLDPKYQGMNAEAVYRILNDKLQDGNPTGQPGQSQGQGQGTGQPQGNGQGQSATGGPGGRGQGQGQGDAQGTGQGQGKGGAQGQGQGKPIPGKVLDAAPNNAPAALSEAAADWERKVRQAVSIAKARGQGLVPGELASLVKAINKPKLDWRSELRRFIDTKVNMDYSWTNPNKRFLNTPYVLPGVTADGIAKLGIVVDTSGSVGDACLKQFLSEIASAIDAGCIHKAIVVQCDAKVQKVDTFEYTDEVKLDRWYGRGGTRFAPAIEWFTQNEPDVAAMLYFTDLECNDFGKDPGCPVMWIATCSDLTYRTYAGRVPFGEVIRLDD